MAKNYLNIKFRQKLVNKEKIKKPYLYNVILNNDDYTSMDFVIDILMSIFNKSYEQAYIIMLEIHNKQNGIAGCYYKEIAVEKANKIRTLAKINNFPLNCRIEKS